MKCLGLVGLARERLSETRHGQVMYGKVCFDAVGIGRVRMGLVRYEKVRRGLTCHVGVARGMVWSGKTNNRRNLWLRLQH